MKYIFTTTVLLYLLLMNFCSFGQITLISSSLSNNLTACLNDATYTVTINNLSPYNLSNIQVGLHLPEGINYVSSSVTGGAENIVTGVDTLRFTMANIPSLSQVTFSVVINAGCMQSYTAKKNTFKMSYTGDNGIGGIINATETHESNLYTISVPDLSLVSMTNQSYSGNVGDVFTRCITITNGGNGSLAQFELEHNHGSGLVIQTSSPGTSTPFLNGTIHLLSASDFATIGNGNGTFDPGESITICETIEIISCSNAQSVYNYRWGCNNTVCQQLSDAANVVFESETPNLVFTPWNSFTNNTTNGLGTNCYGNNGNGDFPSSLTIVNNGTGDAINTLIDVGGAFSSHTGWVYTNYYSSINIASLTIEINGGGQQAIVPVSTANGQSRPCLPASPKNGFVLNIPLIEPGDIVVIRWNHFTCCIDYCENATRKHLLHWRFRGSYTNRCGINYDIPQSNSLPNSGGSYYYRNQLSADVVPGTMINGETSTVTFMAVNSEFNLPRSSNHRFKYRLILPDGCLNVNTNSLVIRNHLGVVQGHVPTVELTGDTVDFVFTSIPMGTQWTISFDLSVDCASCPVEGLKTIQFQTLYAPNINCSCWQMMGCVSANIDVLCPPVCEGANLVEKRVRRINLGLPDNDNNGLPDNGPHNMNQVRTDRMMHGDTLEVYNKSFIHNPNNMAYRSIVLNHRMMNHGQRMTYSHSIVRIYKAASNTYFTSTAQNINTNITTTGTTRSWRNGFNIQTLPSLGMGTGSLLETGDSVIVLSYYVNTVNNNTNYLDVVNTESSMFATSTAAFQNAPTNELFGCNTLNKEFTLIGWYYTNSGENSLTTNNCNEIVLTQNYYLSIGPCCNNYNGGNLFPFEYRHWSAPGNMFVELPDDYEFISASFNFAATGGTLVTRPDNVNYFPIAPVSVAGNIYEFDLYPFFGDQSSGNPIIFGDDGFNGNIRVRMRPTCNVENGTSNTRYRWNYIPVSQLNPTNYATTGWLTTDPVTYNGPILSMQSNILMVNSQSGQETWDLFFQNTSFSSAASNFWIGVPSNGGITADSILNLATNTWYYPNANGIFALVDLPANSSVTYRLFTTMTSCQSASIVVSSGWGCSGVPATVADYECEPLELTLTINPLTPSFEAQIALLSNGVNELCDELDFEITVRNYQLGYGFNMLTDIQLPYGLEYVTGSGNLFYQGTTTPLPDPGLVSGTTFQWDLSTTNLSDNGLIGIVDSVNNKYTIRFKARPLCGFNSGQRVFVRGIGESFCGSVHQSELNYSAPIYLNNMTAPYTTDIAIGIDFITPCGPNNETTLTVHNLGNDPFGATDTLNFVLPAGLTYTPNSFVPIHNASIAQTEPIVVNSGAQITLKWPLMPGVAMGDSMVFEVNLNPSPIDLPCVVTELRAFTTVLLSATCSIDGNICSAGLITGENVKPIYIYKTDLDENNAVTNVHLNPDGSETLSGSFSLYNQGASLSSSYSLVYEILHDVNGDGIYSAGDTVVWTETVSATIPGGASETFTFSNIPVNEFCGGSIRLSLVNNACFCSDNIFTFNLTTSATNFADTICSQDTVMISYPDLHNYSYSWSPTAGLSDGTIPQPLFAGINAGNPPVSHTFIRTVDKGICQHIDTSVIVIRPLPGAEILLNDTLLCESGNDLSVPLHAYNSFADYTLNYSVDGVMQTTTFTDTFFHTLPVSAAGDYFIQLNSVTDGSPNACSSLVDDSVLITVNPLPVAQVYGDTTVCMNTTGIQLTFEGSNATAEYVFDYVFGGDTFQVTTTNGIAQVTVPTDQDGSFSYETIHITESSAAQCTAVPGLENTVVVLPLPHAEITADTLVCQDDPGVALAITGSNSTAPYIFTYTVNGVPQTGSGTPVLSILQSTTVADTFSYHLTGVTDGSIRTCNTILDTTIRVIVNPLPNAQVIGDTSVCHLSPAPSVTFIGANGTSPYIFTYTYNGDTLQVTAPVDSVLVSIATDSVGTYPIELLSVMDSSPTMCISNISSSAIVDVRPNPLASIASGTIVCQNDPEPTVVFTGSNATPGYTFTYAVNSMVSTISSTGNSTQITIPTTVADTFHVQLTNVTESSISTCSTVYDTTLLVIVNPLPTLAITGDTSVCELDDEPVITFTAGNGTAPYWVYFTLNGTADSLLTTGTVAEYLLPTTTPGTYTFSLTGVKDSSPTTCYQSANGTVTVEVRDRPTAVITGSTEICQDSNPVDVVIIGNGTTNPYTFHYTLNGTPMTAVSVGDSIILTQPTSVAGDFVYHLTGVTDNTVNTCYRELHEEILIRINELPYAMINGNATICLNTTPAPVLFIGEMGTPGYVFDYEILETSESLSVSSGNGSTVTVLSINGQPGTYTYVLTGVTDSSPTQCHQQIYDTVVIEVIDLPAATITGFSPLCEDEPEPEIIFTGSNGGSPYTFVYTLNGSSHTVTTSNTDSIVSILQPTDQPGTFTYTLTQVTEGTYGCTANLNAVFTGIVYPKPTASFSFSPDELMTSNSVVYFINVSTGATSYDWEFGDESSSSQEHPNHLYEVEGIESFTIYLVATSEFGCIDSTSATINVKEEVLIYVPNTFTPDGDVPNNTFFPVIKQGIELQDYTMIIYNRWGENIFESHDVAIGWDGTYKGKMVQSGTYTYTIEIKHIGISTRERIVGHVNVLR